VSSDLQRHAVLLRTHLASDRRFHVANAELALSILGSRLIGMLRLNHTRHVDQKTVDQLAALMLGVLGVPQPYAARIAVLPLPNAPTNR
jgi:hypothetical protein